MKRSKGNQKHPEPWLSVVARSFGKGKQERAALRPDYQSYLLRLWRAYGGQGDWRASLERASTGERKGFATLAALFDYVRSQTRGATGEEVTE